MDISTSLLSAFNSGSSGLDIKSIVASLVDEKKTPATKKLETKAVGIQQKISAYGELKSKLADLQTKIASLKTAATLNQHSASLSQTTAGISVAIASASTGAIAGSYDVEVLQLAQSQVLSTDGANNPFVSLSDVIGSGKLEITFGENNQSPVSIDINDENNTLESFRHYINSGNYGFKVSTIYNGKTYNLILTASQPGENFGLNITALEDGPGGDDGLSRLNFNAESKSLKEARSPLDSLVKINGIGVSFSSNSISDAIPGVMLTLKNANQNDAVKLDITTDISGFSNKVNDFVSAFNAFEKKLNEYITYDVNTKTRGIFFADIQSNGMARLLSSNLISSIPAIEGLYKNLSDVGITANAADGLLSLDGDKLSSALARDSDQVRKVFLSVSDKNSLMDSLAKSLELIQKNTTTANNQLMNITNQKEVLNKKMAAYEARLTAQFNRMDKMVSALKYQSNFLTKSFSGSSGNQN